MGSVELKYLASALPYGVLVLDSKNFKIVEVNRRALDLLEVSKEEIEGRDVTEVFPEATRLKVLEIIHKAIEGKEPEKVRLFLIGKRKRECCPVEVSAGTFGKSREYILLTVELLKEDRVGEGGLKDVLERAELMSQGTKSKLKLFEETVGILKDIPTVSYVGIHSVKGRRVLSSGRVRKDKYNLCFPVYGQEGRVSYYLLVSPRKETVLTELEISVIAEIIKKLAQALERSGGTSSARSRDIDTLTGLPTRASFEKEIAKKVKRKRKKGPDIAVVVFDIDRFGEINQALGTEAGDEILAMIVDRIRSSLSSSDFLARTGSDEFGVILISNNIEDTVKRLLQRVKEAFKRPFQYKEHRVYISLSVGVTTMKEKEEGRSLLTEATSALRKSKELGGNITTYYSAGMMEASERSIKVRSELRDALERGELVLFFQPKINLITGKIAGAEALIRWIRKGQLIPPMHFIPIIEEGELIHEVGEFVLREVCKYLRKWKRMGIAVPIAINVSATQLKSLSFVKGEPFQEDVCKDVEELIEVEITESTIMNDVMLAIEFINNLAIRGIKTYIDDFGTGYSSLAYLKKLPVYALKIDKEFVRDIPYDRDNFEIVKVIITLAKNFGLKCVAEGVEKPLQADILRDLGCEMAQGFYFGKPMPADKFENLLLNA